MIGLERGTVTLTKYCQEWADDFQRECVRLRQVLGESVGPFEHVGSTAIPGIPSKPIIDL